MDLRHFPHDAADMAGSIRAFPAQCRQAFDETAQLPIPAAWQTAHTVVVCGMGGSALGAHLAQAACADWLAKPLVICNQYTLPGWVDAGTLVLLASYSGSTAETLACATAAAERGALLGGITAGGPLLSWLHGRSAPVYHVRPDHNPCGQPRMALGYAVIGLMALLAAGGVLPNGRIAMETALDELDALLPEAVLPVPGRAPLPDFTAPFSGQLMQIVASEHLEGNAHILANQVNENAKAQATWHSLPEVNHHLLEGMGHPADLTARTRFLFLVSERYRPENQARYAVMRELLASQGVPHSTWTAPAASPLGEALVTLAFGSWVSFLLAQGYGIDPSPVPYVTAFKEALAQRGF